MLSQSSTPFGMQFLNCETATHDGLKMTRDRGTNKALGHVFRNSFAKRLRSLGKEGAVGNGYSFLM